MYRCSVKFAAQQTFRCAQVFWCWRLLHVIIAMNLNSRDNATG